MSSAVAGVQSIEQLDSMLARVDDAAAALTEQDTLSRAPAVPYGPLQLANTTPLNDPLIGRE